MTSGTRTTIHWFAGVFTLAIVIAVPPLGASRMSPVSQAAVQAQAAASGGIDTELLGGIQFRHLSVFSRGGRVTAVAGVPSNQQLYYMGSTGGGVWRTTDAGATWTQHLRRLLRGRIDRRDRRRRVQSERHLRRHRARRARAATSRPASACTSRPTPARPGSTSACANAGTIGRIRIHPTNPDLVYVAVLGNLFAPSKERGVYRSRDGGTHLGTGPLRQRSHRRRRSDDGREEPEHADRRACGRSSASRGRSTPAASKAGSSARPMAATPGRSCARACRRAASARSACRSPARTRSASTRRSKPTTTRAATFRSDDGGATWTRTFTGRSLQQRAWYYTHIYADPVDADTVYALNVGAFKSTDGGKTFQRTPDPVAQRPPRPLDQPAQQQGDGRRQRRRRDRVASTARRGPRAGQPADVGDLPARPWTRAGPYWVYGAQQDNSTIAVPSQGNDDDLRRRRRRERPHRRRSARLQHRLRRQLRRDARRASIASST